MNTANRPERMRAMAQSAPVGLALRTAPGSPSACPTWPQRPSFCPPGTRPNERVECAATSIAGESGSTGSRGHSLVDAARNRQLRDYECETRERFDAIVPTLKLIAARQHEPDFSMAAQEIARQRLGFELPAETLEDAWVTTLDMGALYAHCVLSSFRELAGSVAAPRESELTEADAAVRFFIQCGFHQVDLSPCADGRLKGLLRYILRLPHQAVGNLNAHAGAMFDVEATVNNWTHTELRRYREGLPSLSDAGTRYLKVAVYHFSTSAPLDEGCAAHGSDQRKAAESALTRLDAFRTAIENGFCCGASVATLLIGVDTDTDAITVHLPDARGLMSFHRAVEAATLFDATSGLSAPGAIQHIRDAIDQAARQDGWGRGDGPPAPGMRELIARLLINNFSQIQYVREFHGGRYGDIGHRERFICVGDGFEELQLRNLSYLAQMKTVEEGATDVDVGIRIFTQLNVAHGLPIPVAIHYRYDAGVPEARQRAIERCRRVKAALLARHDGLARRGLLVCGLSVQARGPGSALEMVPEAAAAREH